MNWLETARRETGANNWAVTDGSRQESVGQYIKHAQPLTGLRFCWCMDDSSHVSRRHLEQRLGIASKGGAR